MQAVNKQELGTSLAHAFYEMSHRGLVKSATWAADALVGLDVELPPVSVPPLGLQTMQAKAYIDGREYLRAWNVLKNPKDPVGRFLRLFARYHAGEAVKETEMGTQLFVDKSKQEDSRPSPVNEYLDELLMELDSILASEGRLDPHLRYLKGVFVRAKSCNEEAVCDLWQSCREYPFNWSCWLELRSCFTCLADADTILTDLNADFAKKPAEHAVMLTLFRCWATEELEPATTITLLNKQLLPLFPKFPALVAQLARVYNGEGEYDASAKLFAKVLAADPYRLEDLDAYSNLLYVTDQRAKLAFLAQHVSLTDRYRTESCCIVANYYSLRGEHEKAVQQYRRAIVLNRNYISSWTLMGHEFIELGNPHAAIETYRQAVQLAPYDFRPWFGLGQAYEVLSMHYFALYYFQRALALRPSDVRLWDALGTCYEILERSEEAINAFQQAFHISEGDVYYNYRMGILYFRIGDIKTALQHIAVCADSNDDARPSIVRKLAKGAQVANASASNANAANTSDVAPSATTEEDETSEWPSRARLWLAKYAMRNGDWTTAVEWAEMVSHGTREMLEEARSIEREARQKQHERPLSSHIPNSGSSGGSNSGSSS